MKDEVISFKLDHALYEKLKEIPDRSKFIRSAIEAALEDICPLCNGTGIMSKEQKKHWNDFTKNHSIEKCPDCGSLYIKCYSNNSNKK
ncbi:MAG: CopG family transcriptional regulator [Spirochaetota bacterium]